MRKKRLITMIAVVAAAAICLAVIAYILMKRDMEEYIRWQAQYKGVWESADGNYEMTVRRITSAHLIFSIYNKERDLSLEYACATVDEGEEYSFQYDLSRRVVGTVVAGYGKRGSGTIRLQEESVALDVKAIEGFQKYLEFQGTLKKKSASLDKERKDLQELMGKGRPNNYSESESLYTLEEKQGKINRTHITWDADRKQDEYEKYEMNGINSLCLLSDLETKFGEPEEEEELARNRYRRTYEKDGYRYWFITDGYGLVVEGDCQYLTPENGRREGDFMMEGNTVIRYTGDYEKNRTIVLPEGTKKIAGGAFTVAQNLCPIEYICTTKLNIPGGIEVEKEAFRNCAKMRITLEEGWTSVPTEAFAHMVEEDTVKGKNQWIEVTLPSSCRRLEERAFETKWFKEKSTDQSILEYDTGNVGVQPVTVSLNDGLEYIGDNALFGIMNNMLPKDLKYLGENYFLSMYSLGSGNFDITDPIDSSTEYIMQETAYTLPVPDHLEKVSEKGIRLVFSYEELTPDGVYDNPAVIKASKHCQMIPHLYDRNVISYVVENGNENYRSEDGWLYSKDGKTLYGTTCRIAYNGKSSGKNFRFYRSATRGGVSRTEVYIPEGVKEIAEHALSDFAVESFEVSSSEEYDEWETIDKHQYILPKSLKRIARNAFFSMRNYGNQSFEVKITGTIPQFYGEFQADCRFKNKIYVKKQDREKFIRNLEKGQELTEEQKTKLEKCIVGY